MKLASKWHLDHAIRTARISKGASALASRYVSRMSRAGAVPRWYTPDRACEEARCSRRSWTTYMRELEAAGLLERAHHTAWNARAREARRYVRVISTALYPQAPTTPLHGQASDLRKGKSCLPYRDQSSSGSLRSSTTGPYAERDSALRDFPALYRTKSDIPLLRPGYGVSIDDLALRNPERTDPTPAWREARAALATR